MSKTWKDDYTKLITDLDPLTAESSRDDANLLKLPYMPASVFKYREVNDRSLSNLIEDLVWLAPATSFNDPYDSSVVIDHEALLRHQARLMGTGYISAIGGLRVSTPPEVLSRVASFNDPFEGIAAVLADSLGDRTKAQEVADELRTLSLKQMREASRAGLDKMQTGMKVCSFSAAPIEQGLLMWGHYAKWHSGFCIEYDVSSFRDRMMLHPVIYSDRRFDLTPYLAQAIEGSTVITYAHAAALHKHPDWSYEDEWRLVAPLGGVGGSSFAVPKPAAIYLGSKISSADRQKVVDISRRRAIRTYQMELSGTHFALIAKQIS